jgi:hypothetical protein
MNDRNHELEHIAKFEQEVRRVGKNIGEFLHLCINRGVDIGSPDAPTKMSLTVYDLGFVLEVIEQHLQDAKGRA